MRCALEAYVNSWKIAPVDTIRALILAPALLLGCGSSNSGNSNGNGTGGSGTGDCSSIGPTRTLSQSCCLSLGVDACGPGLVCAALDGRTIAACYAEKSRTGGQSCTEDSLCESNECDAASNTCLPDVGDPCTQDVSCAHGRELPLVCAGTISDDLIVSATGSKCIYYQADAAKYDCCECVSDSDCGYGNRQCILHICAHPEDNYCGVER
jgi:hypothetical protein